MATPFENFGKSKEEKALINQTEKGKEKVSSVVGEMSNNYVVAKEIGAEKAAENIMNRLYPTDEQVKNT